MVNGRQEEYELVSKSQAWGPLAKAHAESASTNAEASIKETFSDSPFFVAADESDAGIGLCGWLLTAISWAIVMVTLPFSLCICFKVRRGRSSQGGASTARLHIS